MVDIPDDNKAIADYWASDWKKFKNIQVEGTSISTYNDGVLNYLLIKNPEKPKAVVISGNYSELTSVSIPEKFTDTSDPDNPVRYYVIAIGEGAFKDCKQLQSVNINSRSIIELIGKNAFNGCQALKEINLPATLKEIDNFAFSGCTSMTAIEIPGSVTTIGSSAFSGCTSMTAIEIPGSVTTIGSSAFYRCRAMTSAVIGNAVEAISYEAFSDCTSLKSIKISNSVKTIDDYAFSGCTSLTSLSIPSTVEKIGDYAFRGCLNLMNITLNEGLKYIGSYAFSPYTNESEHSYFDKEDIISSKSPIYIPSTVETICDNAFFKRKFSEVNISDVDSWLKIDFTGQANSFFTTPLYGTRVLKLNGKLVKSVTVPESITEIKRMAFFYCDSLSEVKLPEGLKSIGHNAFAATNVSSITLPPSVTFVDFGGLSSVKNLTVMDGDSPIEFDFSAVRNISSLSWGRPWESLTFNVDSLVSLTIGNPITTVPANKFSGLTKLKTVKLGTGLKEIGDNAFSGCTALEEVIVPPSVESIGVSAFDGDTKLKSIIMGHSVKTIGEKAFNGAPAATVSITAQEPPTAPNNTFSNYTGKLYVQGEGTAQKYYDALTCWDRFDSYVMIVPEKLEGNNDKVIKGEPDEQVQLEARIWPDNVTLPYVFWRSTNPEIATVDENGLVTFHVNVNDMLSRAGASCKIIAETLYADGPVLEFDVEVVTTGTVQPTGITLDAATAEITEGDTKQLTATIAPDDATDKTVTWTSSDESVATVSASGLVTAIKPGTATITATTANGLTATCTITVVAKPSGIDNVDGDSKNPVHIENGEIVIDGDGTAEVFNISGVRVAVSNEGRISGLPRGIYIVRLAGKTVKVRL